MNLISESTHIFNGITKEVCYFVDLGADKITILRTESRQRGEETLGIQWHSFVENNVVDHISYCHRPFCKAELNAAERATSSVVVQRWCRPLYGAQSSLSIRQCNMSILWSLTGFRVQLEHLCNYNITKSTELKYLPVSHEHRILYVSTFLWYHPRQIKILK